MKPNAKTRPASAPTMERIAVAPAAAPTQAAAPSPAFSIADPNVPCVLAHDIVSHSLRSGINYMYLGRVDMAPMGGSTQDLKIIMQLAMPLDGFLSSFFMLEAVVRRMQKEGVVSEEMVAAGRARYLTDSGKV